MSRDAIRARRRVVRTRADNLVPLKVKQFDILIDVDGDYSNVFSSFIDCQLIQLRQFDLAGSTPAGPEIDENHLALVIA